ncbi:hypothetical protein CTI12_AA074690 [Artemisia annua]|uniref:Pentatricopeptide repeat-containing protein n=1 Tax=Artemisia annua TaxID=35608 RepID=A0A2U1Q517_ARTAN|nr:hypothetical protein CTI12_AA074690 [Artemisia annua]
MQKEGVEGDRVAVLGLVQACANVGNVKIGLSVNGYLIRRRAFYGCGSSDESCGYARDKRKREMQNFGLKPDEASIIGELLACSQLRSLKHAKSLHAYVLKMLSLNEVVALSDAGLVEEGRLWFNLMVHEYNIEPTSEHYTCMADLLARGGHVEEAYDLISSMKTEPGLAFWPALLSGCHNHGIYGLISNFYAKMGKWTEVADVRNVMKRSGIKKVPGNSVVEVNGELHAFVMEDKSHFQYQEILKILEFLDLEMTSIEDQM